MPRYLGRLSRISGTIERDEALERIRECKEFSIPDASSAQQGKVRFVLIALAVVFAMALFLFSADTSGDVPPDEIPMAQAPGWFGLCNVAVWSVAGLWLALFIFAAYRERVRPETSDPPIWGDCDLELFPDGFRSTKRCKLGVMVTVYGRWRETQIRDSEDAWYFLVANVEPVLVLKSWVTDSNDRQTLNGFFYELSRWRFMNAQLASKDDKSGTEFEEDWLADLRPVDGIRFETKSRMTRKRRRLLTSALKENFPEWSRNQSWSTSYELWRYGGGLIAAVSLLAAVAVAAVYSEWRSAGVSMFAPTLIMGALSYWIAGQSIRGNLVKGWVSRDCLWIDQDVLDVKLNLSDYTDRRMRMSDDLFFVANDSGIAVFWFFRDSFENETDWDAARALLGLV